VPTTLFVTISPRRIAVAAVSEVNPFHAAAVRQVIDDLAQKGCDELGIVTNARLTAGSKEYARSRRCTLIGEEEFPDFVLARIKL
jgi:HJR/Mrr/RecB family endonuclease